MSVNSELQKVLQMERYQNNADALVHPLQFEIAKSCWANHKVCTLKDCDDIRDEEKQQGTESQSLAPQYEELSLIHIYKHRTGTS